jgi:hypothetical protein
MKPSIERVLRRDYKKKPSLDLALIFAGTVALFFLGYAVYVHAATFPEKQGEPIKSNADYCREVMEGKWTVIGATPAEVATYCGL